MTTMEDKTISFSTGNLIIKEKTISFHHNGAKANNVNIIERENIGYINKEPMKLLPKEGVVYCFQMAVIGITLAIIGLILGITTNFYIALYVGIAFIYLGSFLFFAITCLDDKIGLSIAKPILLSLFGVDTICVIVQNVYGNNNLQFFVRLYEQSNIPNLEDYKLDKVYNLESVNSTKNNINDIEQNEVFRDNGILSQIEFDLKKKQILGL